MRSRLLKMPCIRVFTTVSALLLFLVFRTAHAGTLDGGNNAAEDSLKLTLSQLALADGVRLSPGNSEFSLYIPVNPGLRPEQAVFQLLPAPGMSGASLWVESGGRIIATRETGNDSLEWQVPLSGATVRNGLMELFFHFVPVEEKEHCITDQATWVYIDPGSHIAFSAVDTAAQPALISHFFPPRLERVQVYTDKGWSRKQVQSFLDLVVFLARTHVPTPQIIPREPGAPLPGRLSPFERVVIIDGGRTGTFLHRNGDLPAYSVLRLAPGADGMTPRLLFNTSHDLFATVVTGIGDPEGRIPANPTEASGRLTLAALGYGDLQAKGKGSMSIRYRFSQADLGGPIRRLGLRLAGTHSAIPDKAEASLWLRMNGSLFYSQALEGSEFDLYAPVPDHLLQRDNTLEVVFVYTPPGGVCEPGTHPFAASVWKSSYIHFEEGQTLPGGFMRFPQAYARGMEIAIEPMDLQHIYQAARLLAAMQRTTRSALFPDLGQTTGERPLLYVGEKALSEAPLQIAPFILRTSSGEELLRFEPGSDFAALEAWDQTVMLAGPVSLASRLLDNALEPDGWYGITGDTWLQGTRGKPRALSLRATSSNPITH